MKTNSPLFGPRGSEAEIEEGTLFAPKFDADGLIPAVATDAATGEVLMFAWMNAEALEKTILTGEAWYWSRSRKSLWRKGETSGQTQTVARHPHRLRSGRASAESRCRRRRRRLPCRLSLLLLPLGARRRGGQAVKTARRGEEALRSQARLNSDTFLPAIPSMKRNGGRA